MIMIPPLNCCPAVADVLVLFDLCFHIVRFPDAGDFGVVLLALGAFSNGRRLGWAVGKLPWCFMIEFGKVRWVAPGGGSVQHGCTCVGSRRRWVCLVGAYPGVGCGYRMFASST